jgi:hypothetical protein
MPGAASNCQLELLALGTEFVFADKAIHDEPA